jgi:hypothetical protein
MRTSMLSDRSEGHGSAIGREFEMLDLEHLFE